MKMTGEERIDVPRVRAWEALNDPEVLRRCIPGCSSLEKEAPDRLRAVVEVKVGPIGARFNSSVVLSDIDPQRSYKLTIEGQGGTIGSAKSDIRVRLTDAPGGALLAYEVEATIGGRLAQLGGGLIDATAKQFATRFFKSFGEIVGESTRTPPAAQVARVPSSHAVPVAWLLAVVVAALVGFLVGRATTPQIVVDAALLQRLLNASKP